MEKNVEEAPDYLQDSHLGKKTKEYLKILNAGTTPVESLPVKDARNVLAGVQASVQVDLSGIEETEKTVNAGKYIIKLNIVRPEGVNGKLPVFIFIHGGGWVLGDYPTHRRLVRDLVVESGCASVFINYTPSPEAKFPQPTEEIYSVVEWVAENGDQIGVDGKCMAIVGNSVGGNMSCVACLMAKENNGPQIKLQILLWPVTDATFEWESWKKYGRQRFLTASLMQWMFDQYTDDPAARRNIHLSLLQATPEQLKGLPPTLIPVAENDILRDQGEALGRLLDEAGVEVVTMRYNGVIHDWGMLNGFANLPETRSLILHCAAALKDRLK